MKTIAIIEDDIDICRMIKNFLTKHGYDIHYASDGISGLTLCKDICPDLILLDLMLPNLAGNELLIKIRAFTDVPVIVVSAKTMVQSKIDLLKSGADDYITKPFDLYELLARIEANLKRSISEEEIPNVTYKELEIKNSCVFINDKNVPFTSTELKILQLMMSHPQKIFSKQNLYESVWQEDYAFDNDTINSHISNIRRKIKSFTHTEYIETVWGIGYKMK